VKLMFKKRQTRFYPAAVGERYADALA
jgi:hypothetical protein